MIEQSPMEQFKETHPSGSRIKGIIRNVTDKGLFVEVAENIVGPCQARQYHPEGK
ncbi:MAG: hypothetical protein R3B51_11925 [Thermodesulfobacteriota bacterium]